jgi:hypothetical protein
VLRRIRFGENDYFFGSVSVHELIESDESHVIQERRQ